MSTKFVVKQDFEKKKKKKNEKLIRQNVHRIPSLTTLMIGEHNLLVENLFTDRKKKAYIIVKPIDSSLRLG